MSDYFFSLGMVLEHTAEFADDCTDQYMVFGVASFLADEENQ